MAPPRRVVLALYRGLLREARHFDQTAASTGNVDVLRELARLERHARVPMKMSPPTADAAPAFGHAVRAAFRASASQSPAESDVLVDRAFTCLRWMSTRRAQVANAGRAPKPTHVHLDVGQVYRHKRWGYRGVVIDWFPQCPADAAWVEQFGPFANGLQQSFYRTAVCVRDRPQPFLTLAAEENLLPVQPGSEDARRPVEHPLVDSMFAGFADGFHRLAPSLWAKFPEDF